MYRLEWMINFGSQPKKTIKPYILAVGNDLARDWDILLEAWDEDFPTKVGYFTS